MAKRKSSATDVGRFPIFESFDDVLCSHCGARVSSPFQASEAAPGRGAWRGECGQCRKRTYFDIPTMHADRAKRKSSKKVSTAVKIEKETREFDTAEYVQMIADIYDILWPGGHHDAEWDSDTASDIALTFFARDLGPKQS